MVLGTLWDLLFDQKPEKQGFGGTSEGHGKGVPKICVFRMAGSSKSEPPLRRERDFHILCSSRKGLFFGGVLVPPFKAFGVSYPRKYDFSEVLEFGLLFKQIFTPF